jgi:hypothetical protein
MSAKLRLVGSYSGRGHAVVLCCCLVDVRGVGHFGRREPVDMCGLKKN